VLCEVAKESDARLVIVNADPTPYDTIADAIIPGRIGEVVPSLLSILPPPSMGPKWVGSAVSAKGEGYDRRSHAGTIP